MGSDALKKVVHNVEMLAELSPQLVSNILNFVDLVLIIHVLSFIAYIPNYVDLVLIIPILGFITYL